MQRLTKAHPLLHPADGLAPARGAHTRAHTDLHVRVHKLGVCYVPPLVIVEFKILCSSIQQVEFGLVETRGCCSLEAPP